MASSNHEKSISSAQAIVSLTIDKSYNENSVSTGQARNTPAPSSHPIHAKYTTQIFPSKATTTSGSCYKSYITYEEAIKSGLDNLGMKVLPHLQRALNDRHGEHSNRLIYQDAFFKVGLEVPSLEEYGPYQPNYNSVNEGENLPGDLVGIGAQFAKLG
jgi:hypothetical protein